MNTAKLIITKGKQLYYKLQPGLEKHYESNKYIAIEVDSGKYFIGRSALEAIHKAKEVFPQRQFYLSQIGKVAGLLK